MPESATVEKPKEPRDAPQPVMVDDKDRTREGLFAAVLLAFFLH